MTNSIRIGVLDQIPIREGGTAATAIAETFELAQHADRLGYSRYWLAEHHNAGSLACASPEVLIPQVAWRTSRIRVGSGGIMLPHYSALKVAENFRTITTQFPDRIDLGVGRAPGSDGRTARALVHGPGSLGIDHFPEQLLDLYGWLADDLPPDHEYRDVSAAPPNAPMPQLWLLGSSHYGGHIAAELGWPHCFAHFISPDGGEQVVRKYRERFEPSPVCPEPTASLGVSVTVAETDEEAEHLCWSRWCWRIKGNRGMRGGIPSVEEALAFPYTQPELDYLGYMQQRSIHGSPQRVRERLERLAAAYDVNEFVVLTITHDFAARKRSYELLADVLALPLGEPDEPGAAHPSHALNPAEPE